MVLPALPDMDKPGLSFELPTSWTPVSSDAGAMMELTQEALVSSQHRERTKLPALRLELINVPLAGGQERARQQSN